MKLYKSTQHRNIDIIIPVYKNAQLTAECVASIIENINEISERDPRVILINDSPDDEEVSAVIERFKETHSFVLLLENETNVGFVKTVNRGLSLSIEENRDVILVNSDTVTFGGTLANLLDAAESDPLIGFASPRSNNASLCSLPHNFGGTPPTPQESYERWKVIAALMPKYHFSPTAVGFYLYISHRVLANFGLLSESFGTGYEEENDFIMRAGKVGYRAILANHAFAFHAGSASFSITGTDVDSQRQTNLRLMTARHPEFLPIVRKYEASPHYRAEALVGSLAALGKGRSSILIDLSQLTPVRNGTNEFIKKTLEALDSLEDSRFCISIACSRAAYEANGFDSLKSIQRVNPEMPGLHCLALRLSQPFDLHHINYLEQIAPVVVYAMLDTIALDCGPLSLLHELDQLWSHVAEHANGHIFISDFAKETFRNRFPSSEKQPAYSKLLPTKLDQNHSSKEPLVKSEHILVVGNHFPHKEADTTAELLAAIYPSLRICVLGSQTFQKGNLWAYRSGTLEQDEIDALYAKASLVVLPSHVEGFGFGLVNALAYRKPVVARDIEAVKEILATYKTISGVHLFDSKLGLRKAVEDALHHSQSYVDDSEAQDWTSWCRGLLDFCQDLLNQPDIFVRTKRRIAAADMMRRASQTAASSISHEREKKIFSFSEIINESEEVFLQRLYLTVLGRHPDHPGSVHYLNRLRAGIDRNLIILDVIKSSEARSARMRNPEIAHATKELLQIIPNQGQGLLRFFGRRSAKI